MGAAKWYYERVAPAHSFIHVDDFDSPKSLANYLRYLDRNDTAYNEYFRWKVILLQKLITLSIKYLYLLIEVIRVSESVMLLVRRLPLRGKAPNGE